MRITAGCCVGVAALTVSIAYAGSQIESTPIYLQSFYKIDKMVRGALQLVNVRWWR